MAFGGVEFGGVQGKLSACFPKSILFTWTFEGFMIIVYC